ncbi:hypothetical protein M378DRAFT_15701 [Amanita muscaria Koide BX008]|uniref:Uncharacterized protein n=1 Tax=Amanita muscaria (strain Koide BX008) TaxID=946122 RepID=A0A0C2S625_AMAMK|nr:hypothetical protein M378DRAFT_15701 [Amanita muscaria Koide BX008]
MKVGSFSSRKISKKTPWTVASTPDELVCSLIVGSRPRRQGTTPHTITTRAIITEEGRVIPSPTIPRQGQSIRSFDLPSRPSTSTRVAAEEIRITRPRGTSVQAQRMQPASYEAIDRTIPRGATIIPPSIPTGVNTPIRLPTTTERPQHSQRVSTVPPTPGPSRTTPQTGPPPQGRGSRGARTRGQNYQRACPIRSIRGTRPHPLDGFYDADHYTEGYDDHVDD